MARARSRPGGRLWPKLVLLAVVFVGIGWAIGGMLGGGSLPRIPGLYRAPEPRAPRADENLAVLSREALEAQVRELRAEVADKNRQIDELTIKLAIETKGSHTAN